MNCDESGEVGILNLDMPRSGAPESGYECSAAYLGVRDDNPMASPQLPPYDAAAPSARLRRSQGCLLAPKRTILSMRQLWESRLQASEEIGDLF